MTGLVNQLLSSMNSVNILFCLILTGSFPFWIFYELTGITKLYTISFLSLNFISIVSSKIEFKLNRYDIFFILFFLYVVSYYLLINRINLDPEITKEFFFEIIKNSIIPYFTGRIIYKKLNYDFFKNIKFIYLIYLLIFIIYFISNPIGFFTDEFRMFNFGRTYNLLEQTHGSYASQYSSTGLGFLFIAFLSKFNLKSNLNANLSSLRSKFIFILPLLIMILIAGKRTLLISLFIFTFIVFINKINLIIKSLLKINFRKLIIPFILTVGLISIFSIKYSDYDGISEIFRFFDANEDYCFTRNSSLGIRLSSIKTSFNVIRDNLIFGVGPANFTKSNCLDYFQVFPEKQYHFDHPHNIILHIFSELGLIGLIPVGITFFQIIKKSNDIIRNIDSSFINIFITYSWQFLLIYEITTSPYFAVEHFFPILTGLIISLITSNKSSLDDIKIDKINKI